MARRNAVLLGAWFLCALWPAIAVVVDNLLLLAGWVVNVICWIPIPVDLATAVAGAFVCGLLIAKPWTVRLMLAAGGPALAILWAIAIEGWDAYVYGLDPLYMAWLTRMF